MLLQNMQKQQQPYPVYLNIYNFSKINKVLNCLNIGGYHTGVQIQGFQYCFCVISSNSTTTGVIAIQPQSADYEFYKKIYLGDTTLSEREVQDLIDELSMKYTCGEYNMFNNNCNHFSDELAKTLFGVGIPSYIFRSTNALSYLCCCLPIGLISGKWAIQAIQQEQQMQLMENSPLLKQYRV